MIAVRFVARSGEIVDAQATPGARLLDVAQAYDQPLEGTCNGQMACSTCHVIVAPEDFAKLPPASDEEEQLLDFVTDACATSRLACQIRVVAELSGISVRMPH